ncbi:MAG: extracellular solute-binding protein, partial [Lachnospiraceae bacterium]|nr:extracellular solute-binding protein [Lachnospiraceae bacterium]
DDGVKVMDGKVGDMQIHWVITDYLSDLENSNDLDELLVAQQAEGASEYDWVDLFVVDELNLEKYIGDGVDVAMDLKSLGISKRQMQQQLPYTRILGSDGRKQRGASIDISPGVFLYRRSIANAVFGTDDPDIVGSSVADWEAFQMTAEKVGSAGYKMLAGFDAAFDAFAESVKDGWYSDEGSVVIDDHLMDWVEMTKKFAEEGLCGDSEMGSEAWLKELTGKGDVFGYFLSAEEIGRLESDYIDEDADSYGDWGIVAGPAGWYRGGTFLCAAVGTPNPEFAAEIIRNLTCNEEVMQEIYEETGLTVNNRKVLLGTASDEAYESGAGIFRDYDLSESSEEENRQESQHDLSDSAGK